MAIAIAAQHHRSPTDGLAEFSGPKAIMKISDVSNEQAKMSSRKSIKALP
jgi:hypothetical protein